jgi:hypothetical protein
MSTIGPPPASPIFKGENGGGCYTSGLMCLEKIRPGNDTRREGDLPLRTGAKGGQVRIKVRVFITTRVGFNFHPFDFLNSLLYYRTFVLLLYCPEGYTSWLTHLPIIPGKPDPALCIKTFGTFLQAYLNLNNPGLTLTPFSTQFEP